MLGVTPGQAGDSPAAQKLLAEDFTTVVMAHGPVLQTNARAKLQKAVERCRY